MSESTPQTIKEVFDQIKAEDQEIANKGGVESKANPTDAEQQGNLSAANTPSEQQALADYLKSNS